MSMPERNDEATRAPEDAPSPLGEAARFAARFGWSWLAVSAIAGLALEAAHGLKLSAYLDDELTRTLLRLAHAHGVGLSLVVLVFGVSAAPRLDVDHARHLARALALSALLVPTGFALGAVAHPEGDPSLGVLLVPLGAIALIYALARTALAMWRA